MSSLFDYAPHPHVSDRQQSGAPTMHDARKEMHGDSAMARFNSKVGLKITLVVGSMWAAYLFTCLALVSAPSAFGSGDPIVIVAWVAQTFLQLILLPIIIVGQNIQAKGADQRSQATYDDATAILEEAKAIQAHLQAQDDAITSILQRLEKLPGATA